LFVCVTFAADPPLPLDEAIYYLKHTESGMYIHPKGGGDVPGDDTPLVFHQPTTKLAVKFLFRTINGYRQLVHFGSGKCVHPKNGNVGSETPLVIHQGNRQSTSVTMKKFDGRTFLVSGADESYYAHPEEGSDHPEDDTWVVWYQERRPGVAIEIVPAEDFTMLSITYDKVAQDRLQQSEVIIEKIVENNGPNPATSSVVLTYSQSVTNTFTYSFTESISVKITNTVKSDFFVAGGTVSVEVQVGFSATQTVSKSVTEGVAVSSTETVSVPPKSAVKVQVITKRGKGKVPFVARVRSSTGKEFDLTGVADVELFFNQDVVHTQVPLGTRIGMGRDEL